MPDAYAGELPVAYVELIRTPRRRRTRCRRCAGEQPGTSRAPKQIILLDKMPLTDAASPPRFSSVSMRQARLHGGAADVAGQAGVSIEMVADAKQGNRAVIKVAAPAASPERDRERIRDKMKYYAMPYEIAWPVRHRPFAVIKLS